jgi:hypothetical protein
MDEYRVRGAIHVVRGQTVYPVLYLGEHDDEYPFDLEVVSGEEEYKD